MPLQWRYWSLVQGSMFSLRISKSTNKGGMSLPVPTPFSIKMALIDRFIRTQQKLPTKEEFEFIRDLKIHIRPPKYIAISGHTVKILDLKKEKPSNFRKFQQTVIYREYVFWQDTMTIALGAEREFFDWFDDLCWGVNYLGKRGGFVQSINVEESSTEPSVGFSRRYEPGNLKDKGFIIVPLDDMGAGLSFEKISPYVRDVKFDINERERWIVPTRLPLKLKRTGAKFRVFVRTET